MQGSQPYATTGRDLFNQIIARILGAIIPGGEALSGFASNGLQRILGIATDPVMDSVLFTNMTPYGASLAQDSAIMQRIAQTALGSTQFSAQFNTMQQLARVFTSQEVWARLKPEERLGSYEAFINSKAQQYMSNPMFSMAYNFLDPLGMREMNRYMSMTASNITRFGLAQGNRNAYINAKQVIGSLFRDEDGNYNFDKRDWGYFNNGEIAAITAAITKHIDVLGNADVSDAESLKNASARLRDTVKRYADALSPLKDLFGSDIPAMIRSIEELTGQDIAQMGPERARAISNMVMDRTSSGRYSMSDLSSWSSQFQTLMRDMDIPVLNKLNGTMYAAFALDATHGGIKPRYMTSSTFMNMAAEQTIRTANSRGADDYDKAYALWAEKLRMNNASADISFTAFQEALRQEATNNHGGNMATAMLTLAGVTNRYELNQGLSSEYYISAKEGGVGALLALDTQFGRERDHARYALMNDLVFRQSIIDLTKRTEYTEENAGADFDRTLAAIMESPDLLNMSGNQQALAFARRFNTGKADQLTDEKYNTWVSQQAADADKSVGAYLKSIGIAPGSPEFLNIQASQRIATQLVTNSRYRNLHGYIFMLHNQRQQARIAQEAASRREYTTQLSVKLGSVQDAFFSDILPKVGNEQVGFSKAISDFFTNTVGLTGIGSDAARDETLTTIAAATQHGMQIYGLNENSAAFKDKGIYVKGGQVAQSWITAHAAELAGKTDDEKYAAFKAAMIKESQVRVFNYVRDSVAYTNSAAGLGNAGYRQMLALYGAVEEPKEGASEVEKQRAADLRMRYAGMMSVYRYVNENAVDDYLRRGAAASAADQAFLDWQKLDDNQGKTLDDYNQEMRTKRMNELTGALREGGDSGVRALVDNTRILDAAAAFQARTTGSREQQSAREAVHARFMATTDHGYGFKVDTTTFDASKFSQWIADEKGRIDNNTDLTPAQKAQQKAALDELAGDITRARTGATAQTNPIVDFLSSISNKLDQIIKALPGNANPGN